MQNMHAFVATFSLLERFQRLSCEWHGSPGDPPLGAHRGLTYVWVGPHLIGLHYIYMHYICIT